MSSAYHKFLKAEIARKNEISTGMELLDDVFRIPLKSFLLIRGHAGVGTTALCLQIASQLNKRDTPVVYVDLFNSLSTHRVAALSNLIVIKSADLSPAQLLESLEDVKDSIIIFDGIDFLEKLWNPKWTFSEFARRLKGANPDATIIATQRRELHTDLWSVVVTLKHLGNIYTEVDDGTNLLAGHLAKISGPMGSTIIYIDHFTGKISRAFDYAMSCVKAGEKSKASVFEMDGLSVRGAWNFIHAIGKKERNELQFDRM